MEHISVRREGALGWITLDRADKLNALTQSMRSGILQALDELEADQDVRVVLFAGARERAFCAGMDVGEFLGRSGVDQWERDISVSRIYERIERSTKPTIASIGGLALGGGCELALACDIRIASETAQLGQLEVRFGLIPGGGGTQRLTRLVGRGQAMRLILSGDGISGQEAWRIGLVDVLAPAEGLRKVTLELANRIAERDALAVRLARESIRSVDELSLSVGLRYEASLMAMCLEAGNGAERIGSFFQRSGDSGQ